MATINTQVTQAGTIHAAANKSLAEAQTKQKTGQPVLTKRLADLAKANSAEQAKVTEAGAALTSAQEDADHLRLSKTFAALYTVRREVSSQDAELAQLKSESESAQTALTNAKAALAAAQNRDLGAAKPLCKPRSTKLKTPKPRPTKPWPPRRPKWPGKRPRSWKPKKWSPPARPP